MEVIDIHPHVISADRSRYPLSPLGGVLSEWVKQRPATCEQYIMQIAEAGIRRAVVVHSSMAYGYDISYAADSADAHRDQFAWVGAVDVLSPDAPERLTYWARERGLVGIRLFLAGNSITAEWDKFLDDPRSLPAWERAQELGLSIKVQTRFSAIERLRKMVDRFPKVKVIVDHLARPPMEDGPPYRAADAFFALAEYPNLYLNIGDSNFREAARGKSTPRAFFERLVEVFGANHLMWGSNFPASAGTVTELRDFALSHLSFLPERDRAQVFAETALSVYPTLKEKG